jgi:hypothetical protein
MGDEFRREDYSGTIENTRKQLAFLESVDSISPAGEALIRQFRAEIEAYEYGLRTSRAEGRTPLD